MQSYRRRVACVLILSFFSAFAAVGAAAQELALSRVFSLPEGRAA